MEPIDSTSFISIVAGEKRNVVIFKYTGEVSVAPVLMIRDGDMKFIACPADPPQLFDLASDLLELTNLAGLPDHSATLSDFTSMAALHWGVDVVTAEVIESQKSRILVRNALTQGTQTSLGYQPQVRSENLYMRNYLDLNKVEFDTRCPQPESL